MTDRDDSLFEKQADRFFSALETGDRDTIATLYAADATIWHNIDEHAASGRENLASLDAYFERVPERRYEHVRRHVLPDGLIQEHVFVGRTAGGRPIRTPMCLIIRFDGDRIVEIREYLDSRHREIILQG